MPTLDVTARWLGFALQPFATAVSAPDGDAICFFESLGWTLPSVPQAWRDLSGPADGMLDALASVLEVWERRAAGEATDTDLAEQSALLVANLAALFAELGHLPDGLRAQLPAPYVAATGIADDILGRLFDSLFDDFLRQQFPLARHVLILLGVIERTDQPEDPSRYQPAYTQVRLVWSRLSLALTDPAQLLRDTYGWGTPTVDAKRLFDALVPLSFFLAAPAEVHCPAIAFVETMAPEVGPVSHAMLQPELWVPLFHADPLGAYVVLTPLPPATSTPQALSATLVLRGDVAASIPLSPYVTFEIEGGAQVGTGLAAVLRPGQTPKLIADASGAGAAMSSGRVRATVRFARPPGRAHLLDVSDGMYVDLDQLALGLEADGGASSDLAVRLELSKLAVVVAAPSSDGFLSSVVPSGLSTTVDASLVWSATSGLHFQGSADLTLSLPVTTQLGPVLLSKVDARLRPAGDGIAIDALLSAAFSIGPVSVELDRFGLTSELSFHAGNLGPLDLASDFSPPQGAGLEISAGPITGGGAIGYDPASGRYSGVLNLQLLDVGIDAYGLLDTRPPGGGYSLAVALSATFPGIPLGLGFTLNGLGGLVCLHRSIAVDTIRPALRNGGIDHIFFPGDPAARAANLISELATFFPATHGRHVVGPAALIEWGAPSVVQAKLAVLLELPSPVRVVVLGDVQLGLPTLDKRVVDIRLDILGVVDFEHETLAIDASLHDSKLAGYALTGDMALRLGWGAAPQFLLAIGGFHPHFTPPPGFPVLRRIALTSGDNPQLRLSAYLALTSNTAQVGARADLTASGDGFEIKAYVGFDALFEFVPFHFEIEITAGASISWEGMHLLGVDLDFVLSGPRPWHAKGDATFGVLWWDVSVGFDTTWGDATPEPLPPPPPIGDALVAALGRPEAWASELPAGEPPWIVLASASSTMPAGMVHPFAALVVRERAVPLGYAITQFGNIPLPAPQKFAITGVAVDQDQVPNAPVTDAFAPGQFTRLSSDQRLAAPSFEQFQSGVRVAADQVKLGASGRSSMDVVTELVDRLAPPPAPPHPTVVPVAVAAGTTFVRPTRPPPQIHRGPKLGDLDFVLASTDDLSITAEGAAIAGGAHTYAGVREALRAQIASTGSVPALQIIPRVQASNHYARVVAVRETSTGRNTEFVDTVTGRQMEIDDFVAAIRAGEYPDYEVRVVHGVPTPVSRPNATMADNLG